MTAPVEPGTLYRRISNLLVRRRQTAELRETNERLEQFASTLRHELRNPLNVLDGYLDIARDGGDAEAFDRCQASVDQMRRLLDQTLLILQGDTPDIEAEPVDLAAICAESWEMVPESDARLEVETTRRIRADADRLRQLLGNLFRNAVEHGSASRAAVERGDRGVCVTVGSIDGGFYVEDDGPGIPEGERDGVFDEGYSIDGSGTGLGLAVVRAVADAHGWDVRITEGGDGGARFEITGVELA